MDLSPRTTTFLARRTAMIHAAPNRAIEVNRLWRLQKNRAFGEIRRALHTMATGRNRCMYCEDNEGTDIDHFKPRSMFPQDAFVWSNYLLGCSRCNSNYKRSQYPVDTDSTPLLIDPTVEDPLLHLDLSLTTGLLVAKTPKGDVSISVFGLNRALLQEGRRDAWITLCTLLPAYAAAHAEHDTSWTDALAAAIRRFPFSAVLVYLLSIIDRPGATDAVPEGVRNAVHTHAEIATWVQ